MSHKLVLLALLAAMIAFPRAGYSQDEGATLFLDHVNKCVYEVIVPKPPEDSVTYERPLPLDLLPFTIRNDKYYSIGTAFAINDTELVTAAHVMVLGVKSQYKEIFVRDPQGHVFGVDNIVKFSSRRDFAVFTVKGRLSAEHLDMNPNSQLNEKVYSVGNALGEGIVVRDGLYTSNTPEEVDGKWNWIRFSAAASPGNSGGPLLDGNGKVIGVILGKSPNENLNMALPIVEVQKGDNNDAEIYRKDVYDLEIFDSVKRGTLDTKIKLPMAYGEFNNSLTNIINEFDGNLLRDLISENKADLFPNGEGSKKLIYKNSISDIPRLIMKREDGNWDDIPPQKSDRSELGNNGSITYGLIKGTLFLKIRKPDTVSLNDFYSDPKLLMDLILKSLRWPRIIGPEMIRVTSLGKADNDYIHADSYGRKWLVKTWPVPYSDMEIVTFSLPVPGGSVTLMKTGQTGRALDQMVPDLKVLTDFVNVAFDGTFKQWREYLGMERLLPSLFKTIELTVDDGHFRYKSKRFKIACDSDVMKINEQTMLTLGFGYYKDGDSIVWDVTKLYLNEDRYKYNGVEVTRNIRAAADADDKYSDHWKRLLEEGKPYDLKTYLIKDNTAISTVYKNFPKADGGDDFSVLYDVMRIKTGMVGQDEMESSINKTMQNLAVYER